MSRKSIKEILKIASEMFPDAKCELNYRNLFELLIAVVLSAQTTDVRVNIVTKDLFERFPTPESLANAKLSEVEEVIKSIGLYKNKAKSIVGIAKALENKEVPNSFEELIKLPGVGRKTANVVLSEGFRIPRIAVDTHVERVSKRLKVVEPSATPLEVEEELMAGLDPKDYHQAHHTLIFFGRYHCLARNPNCAVCPLTDSCRYYEEHYQNKNE